VRARGTEDTVPLGRKMWKLCTQGRARFLLVQEDERSVREQTGELGDFVNEKPEFQRA
jgi:hypothetical protein